MAYRTLAAAALLVACAAPALAETTTYTTTTACDYRYSRASSSGNWSNCTTRTQVKRPDPPSQPNCAYLPNFGGVNPRCGNR